MHCIQSKRYSNENITPASVLYIAFILYVKKVFFYFFYLILIRVLCACCMSKLGSHGTSIYKIKILRLIWLTWFTVFLFIMPAFNLFRQFFLNESQSRKSGNESELTANDLSAFGVQHARTLKSRLSRHFNTDNISEHYFALTTTKSVILKQWLLHKMLSFDCHKPHIF